MTDARNTADYSDLSAIYLNCSLKQRDEFSHTGGLMEVSKKIMDKQKVRTELIRIADHDIAHGVQKDMKEWGRNTDEWPDIHDKVMKADIVVIGTPIWLGEKSSMCTKVIERLYAASSDTNEKGQYVYYGKVGGCVVTGNEDGIKHCAMSVLYALQHLGCTIPPQADCGWVGEAGPGRSYLDEGSGGPDNDFTSRNATFMTWNLLHMANMLKNNHGISSYGNVPAEWEDDKRFGFERPLAKEMR